MPRAPQRPCAAPGCPALVERGRCPKHQAHQDETKREQHRDYIAARQYGKTKGTDK